MEDSVYIHNLIMILIMRRCSLRFDLWHIKYLDWSRVNNNTGRPPSNTANWSSTNGIHYIIIDCTSARLRLGGHWFSRGDNFPRYPLVQSIFIILYECKLKKQIHRIHYVWFQNNLRQLYICVCISYSVYSNAHTTPVRIYGEP